MKIIKENINFTRGLDPKEAMGIGIINVWDIYNEYRETVEAARKKYDEMIRGAFLNKQITLITETPGGQIHKDRFYVDQIKTQSIIFPHYDFYDENGKRFRVNQESKIIVHSK